MQELETERIEKEKDDAQWNEYREASENRWQEPTGQQKAYLRFLAKAAGVDMDLSSLTDRVQASRLIDSLKRQGGQKTTAGTNELRDRKIAFGMATKLVYKKFLDGHYTPGKSQRFWKEVEDFFTEYEKHQEAATSGFSDASEMART